MKKVFLSVVVVFILTVFSAGKVFSQENASSGGASGIFGVRFMPTLTSLKYSGTEGVVETSFILGYGAGLILGTNFNDNVGLQREIIYSQLAQQYKTGGDVERKVKLSYINVPLLLSLNTGISKPVNLNFVIGPQLGLNTGASVDVTKGAESDSVHAVLAVKRVDIGLA